MSRLLARLGVLACALCLVPGAAAAVHRRSAPAPRHFATGTVTAVGTSSLTVITNGRRMGIVNAMIAAASSLTRRDYPYVWGGGHAAAGVASVGLRGGPGANGRRLGFDCSGSVAAVLAAGGLWAPGGGVPGDLGVVQQLLAEHLIAPGPGRTATEVTLYDEPGVHIFMNINGRFFGTSDGAGGGSRKGGPGWLDDGAPDAYSRAFRQYHVLPGVLRDSTVYGHTYTLQSSIAGAAVGDRVQVSFRPGAAGTLSLLTLAWVGAQTAAGTVSALAPDGSGFSVLAPSGQTLTFAAPAGAAGVALGDQVKVTYTSRGQSLTEHAVTITAAPVVLQATGTVIAIAPDGTAFSIQLASGPVLTFSTALDATLAQEIQVGAPVQVSYFLVGPTLVAEGVSATATPGGARPVR